MWEERRSGRFCSHKVGVSDVYEEKRTMVLCRIIIEGIYVSGSCCSRSSVAIVKDNFVTPRRRVSFGGVVLRCNCNGKAKRKKLRLSSQLHPPRILSTRIAGATIFQATKMAALAWPE